jgi:replicative DNA helicase
MFSPETERAVIGSCLMQPQSLKAARSIVVPDHFFNPAHKFLFAAACQLFDDGHLDPLSLIARLREIDRLKDVGGESYILGICEADSGPIGVEYHARDLHRQWLRRKYIALGKSAEEGVEIDELKIKAETLAAHSIPRQSPAILGRLGHFGPKPRIGLATGYPSIDRHLSTKGWPSGQMCIVAAYHKAGKSSFQLSCAIRGAQLGRKPLYATFADMGGHDLEERAMRHETRLSRPPDYGEGRNSWQEVLRKFQEEWPIDVYDAAGLDTGYDVETFALWLESRLSIEGYTEVYVDYAQELRSRDRRALNEQAEAALCASLIQRTARRLDIPIIVGSQITEGRNGERDKTKGSRVWEEKAGLVLRLKREETGSGAHVDIAFNRFGPMGTEPLIWNEGRVRFDEPDLHEDGRR